MDLRVDRKSSNCTMFASVCVCCAAAATIADFIFAAYLSFAFGQLKLNGTFSKASLKFT